MDSKDDVIIKYKLHTMKTILLVEDDYNLGVLLQDYIQLKSKYKVVLAKDGQEGLEVFKNDFIDLCILDVMLPKKDGFSLGQEIRKLNPRVPIIYATAKSMLEDKATAFKLGCDDYITKPFRVEEMLLRINALLKRASAQNKNSAELPHQFSIGSYTFDYHAQVITRGDVKHKISTKEANLLHLLCLKRNDVLTREEALLSIWHEDNYFKGRSMDVFLSKLRKYFKDDPSIEIVNVHGKGYKLIVN